MKLSKTTRKNPTQTKTLQNQYSKDLLRLFSTFRRSAVSALDDTASMLSADTDSVDMVAIDIIAVDVALRQLGVQLITSGADITADYARKSYKSGTTYGTLTLKRIGVEAVIGDGPADWRVIDALKVRNLSALRGITDEMNKQIIRELTDGVQLGESIPKLAARLTDRVDKIGKTRATMMARTEVINAFSQGAELRYAQAGIKTLEWLTAHDDRTCDDCLELDGKQFSIKSAHVRPPLHPNCRCSLLPVIN